MKLAVLGGSFNPVHNGHLMVAAQAADEYGYERILFIPARKPPHKALSAGASAADRLEMLKRALKEYADERFILNDCELNREGLSYTIDTVVFLEKCYAGRLDGKIGVIIGSDLIAGFGEWKEADLLAGKVDILLGRRCTESAFCKNTNSLSGLQEFAWPHLELHNEFYVASSAKIRRMIAEKEEWEALVPQSVYEYIVQRKLYGFIGK